MTLADNKRLFDIATRQAVYVEGVKVWQAQQFDLFLRELSEELRKMLGRIKYKTLDSLTKTQLNAFMIELRRTQTRMYSIYLEKVLEQLEAFMKADLLVTKRIFASPYEVVSEEEADELIRSAEDEETFAFLYGTAAITGSNGLLWRSISNTIVPANGLYMGSFLKGFSTSAQAAVQNAIGKAYANGGSVDELKETLLARTVQGTGGIVQRIGKQANAVLATSMQHISQMVSASIASGLFGFYEWWSVIDSSTTDICRSRNKQRYKFGEGPLPPAHILCRSHISPVKGGESPPNERFADWQARQPEAFRKDVGAAETFSPKPLTSSGYASKVNLILST